LRLPALFFHAWERRLASVTTDRVFSSSAGLAVSTVTPGRTAPDVSLTTPVIDAWANAAVGMSTTDAITIMNLTKPRMEPPLFSFVSLITLWAT